MIQLKSTFVCMVNFLPKQIDIMKFLKGIIALAIAAFMAPMALQAQDGSDVVDIAISSPDHTTLVAAVQAAELVATLKGDGPFTIFAPTNAAFEALPEGTVAALLKPENKEQLAAILTYHVVAGKLDKDAVVKAIESGNGSVTVTTVQGGELTAYAKDGGVFLKDENGNEAQVTATDLMGTNGEIHVINGVVTPK